MSLYYCYSYCRRAQSPDDFVCDEHHKFLWLKYSDSFQIWLQIESAWELPLGQYLERAARLKVSSTSTTNSYMYWTSTVIQILRIDYLLILKKNPDHDHQK